MAEYARNLSILLFTEQCHHTFFVDFDFLNVLCLKAAISKMLGIAIIAGSMLVKVPQIVKILNAGSAEGISVASVFLELFAITASLAYSYVKGFPFSSWGEGLFLALQTCSIAAFALLYGSGTVKRGTAEESDGSATHAAIFLAIYSTMTYVLMSGLTDIETLWCLQAANIPVILAGKSLQAFANYRRGNTGQLSATTLCLLFLGSLARIFTSIQETGDRLIVTTYIAASFANGVIFGQILYYGGSKRVKKD